MWEEENIIEFEEPGYCYVRDCPESPDHHIQGIIMCATHYIEALEHGADMTFDLHTPLDAADCVIIQFKRKEKKKPHLRVDRHPAKAYNHPTPLPRQEE